MITFKKLSIGTQLFLVGFVLITVIPVIIINIYQKASDVIIKQSTQNNIELVSNIQQNITSNYTQISNTLMNLGYDTTVQEFLLQSDRQKTYEMSKKVQSLMSLVKNANPDIIDIVIINAADKSLSLLGNINIAKNMKNSLEQKKGIVYYGGYTEDDISQAQNSFLYGLNLFSSLNTSRYGENVGFIAVILDANSINKYIERTPGIIETNFYFWSNNELVYTSKNDEDTVIDWENLQKYKYTNNDVIYEHMKNNSYVIQSFQIPELKGGIISVASTNHIIKDLVSLKKTSYIIFFVTMSIVAIIYTLLLMNILRPHRKLIEFLNGNKHKPLEVLQSKIELVGYAEIEVISAQFNTMLVRINELTHQLLEANAQLFLADIERQKAEMSFLQSQIKPHFLSNTLDTIKGMAIVNGNKEIFNMASALSRMLRYSIKGSNEVTLKEELVIVESYITIHQGRFPGRITYECHCPDHLLTTVIPKMLLQPLVENALTHGIEPHPEGGHLIIEVSALDSGNIEITVADNGVGIDADRLAYLQRFLEVEDYSLTKHIGIKNVHTRLQLRYGKHYGLTIKSEINNGTIIKITLPM